MATTDAITSDDDEFGPSVEYSYRETVEPRLARVNTINRVNLKNLSPEQQLVQASYRGDVDTVTRLIYSGVPVKVDSDGSHPFIVAASKGHVEVLRIFLSFGIPADICDNKDNTALLKASSHGHREVIQLLIGSGANCNYQNPSDGNSALHEAAWKGYSHSLNILSMSGASVNITNKQNFTALHYTAQNGHNQSTRILLYAGCNPNLKNMYGDTALHTAARYGHAGVARILISARIYIDEINKNWDTALHIAAALKRRKIAKLLVDAGANVKMQNLDGYTPICIATEKNHEEILSIMYGRNNYTPYYQMQHPYNIHGVPANMPLSNSFYQMPNSSNVPPNMYRSFIAQLPQRQQPMPQRHADCQKSVDFNMNSQVSWSKPSENVKTKKKSLFSIFRRKKNKSRTRDASSSPPPSREFESPCKTVSSPSEPFPNPLSDQPISTANYRQQAPPIQSPVNDVNKSTETTGQQKYASHQNLPNTQMSQHVPGFLNHYNVHSGTQYYKDLAGNIKEQRAPPPPYRSPISTNNIPPGLHVAMPYLQSQTGPIGYVPSSCNFVSSNTPKFANQSAIFSGGHGHPEYHGPITRSPISYTPQPMSKSQYPVPTSRNVAKSPASPEYCKMTSSNTEINDASNLPENAPITSMFPAAEPPARLYKSRSDESLNMSEHKQRMREEKMRQIALRELRTYNLAGRESPVRGRRANLGSTEPLENSRGSNMAVNASEINLDSPVQKQSEARVIPVDVAQQIRRHYQSNSKEMIASRKTEDEISRVSPDGQIDSHGELQLTPQTSTIGGNMITSVSARHPPNPVNNLHSINVSNSLAASVLQRPSTQRSSPEKIVSLLHHQQHHMNSPSSQTPLNSRPPHHHGITPTNIPRDRSFAEINQRSRTERDKFPMGTDV